jgi:hypothetical protein
MEIPISPAAPLGELAGNHPYSLPFQSIRFHKISKTRQDFHEVSLPKGNQPFGRVEHSVRPISQGNHSKVLSCHSFKVASSVRREGALLETDLLQ